MCLLFLYFGQLSMKLLSWKKVAVNNTKYTREYPATVHMGESRQMSSVIVYEIHVHIKYAYFICTTVFFRIE